jgi:phosphoglycolate phosphatase
MIKLVIFDLDGTLLNTLDDLADSCNYILRQHNFPTHPLNAYRFFVGNGIAKLVERALPENRKNTEFIEQIRLEFIEYYSLHAEDKTAPYEGIVTLLKELRKQDIELAVASNKFMAGTQALVQKYFGDITFSAVFGQREGIPVKPNPQIVYDIMEKSGIQDKKEILYVGDTGTDMQTCTNAGIKGIGVSWGFRTKEELKENGAAYIVDSPENILDIIKISR